MNIKNVAWFVGYLLCMLAIFVSLSRYRSGAIEAYGTDAAAQKWQVWRDAAEELGREGLVAREQPKSSEPPSLVLMRDHFGACLGISLLLSSCLYLWFMVCVRGVFQATTIIEDDMG